MNQEFRRCADCRDPAPATDTAHTLIGAAYGWRLSVRKLPDGEVVREWRCAACWAERKKRPGPSSSPAR